MTVSLPDHFIFYDKSGISEKNEKEISVLEKTADGDNDGIWLICSVCSNKITRKSDKTAINSSFEHTFTNPHGFLFTINCYINAPGSFTLGNPSADFTWFPGYSWEISICSVCKAHLGWKFIKSGHFFFGFIKEMLIEQRD